MAQTERPLRDYGKFLILAFGLSWSIWIPLLFLSRHYEQLEHTFVIGAFGPTIAAILLSRRGVRSLGRTITSQVLSFLSVLFVCFIILLGHQILWNESPLSFGVDALFLLISAVPAWVICSAHSSDSGIRETMRSLVDPTAVVWPVVALFLFPALLVTSATIARGFGGAVHQTTFAARGFPFFVLATVEYGYAFFLGGGISEEPGWRGFLLPRLQARFSPLLSSLLIWIPWALWHAPLDLAGYGGPTWGAYLRARVFLLIPVSVIVTFLYNRSGGSILSTALFHSAYNIAPDFIPSGQGAEWLVLGVAFCAILADRMWRIRRSLVPQIERVERSCLE